MWRKRLLFIGGLVLTGAGIAAVAVVLIDGLHAIGGTAVGTVLILLFLPALYATWFRIKPTPKAIPQPTGAIGVADLRMVKAAE